MGRSLVSLPRKRLLAGGVIFVLAAIGLAVLGFGILQTRDIVDKFAQFGYARGLITYILATGIVALVLVLVVSALLGTESGKDNFDRGKEILAVLIGLFGGSGGHADTNQPPVDSGHWLRLWFSETKPSSPC
jgi:hypothetical protein